MWKALSLPRYRSASQRSTDENITREATLANMVTTARMKSSKHVDECHSLLFDVRVGRVDEESVDDASRSLSTACFDAGDLDLHE